MTLPCPGFRPDLTLLPVTGSTFRDPDRAFGSCTSLARRGVAFTGEEIGRPVAGETLGRLEVRIPLGIG